MSSVVGSGDVVLRTITNDIGHALFSGKWCLGTGVSTHRGAVRGRPPCLGLLWKFCSGHLVPLARI